MGSRRRAREMALQVLCVLDRQPDLSAEQGLYLFFKHLVGSELEEVPPRQAAVEREAYEEQRRFAETLVLGVRNKLESVDRLLGQCSRNWRLEHMSWVDRNLLRLAAYELRDREETPARVVLNEAIEIARRYSTSESSGFVNGVLDRVMSELGRRDSTSLPSLDSQEHAAEPQ